MAAPAAHGGAPVRFVIHERRIAAMLALGADGESRALVDHDLHLVALAALSARAWRNLITSSLEDLVRALGGDAGDVEQLRREGAR